MYLKLNIIISRNISLDLELWEVGLLRELSPGLGAVHRDPYPTLAPTDLPQRYQSQGENAGTLWDSSCPMCPNIQTLVWVIKAQCTQRWGGEVHLEACLALSALSGHIIKCSKEDWHVLCINMHVLINWLICNSTIMFSFQQQHLSGNQMEWVSFWSVWNMKCLNNNAASVWWQYFCKNMHKMF